MIIVNECNAGLRGKINSGNRNYRKGNYEEALQKYRDALIDDPESKELHFQSRGRAV